MRSETIAPSHHPSAYTQINRFIYNQNELSRLYGEPFEKFLAVRRRLDPTDMFLNAHLRDLFLPWASK